MALRALQAHLESTFHPPAGQGMDAIIRLAVGDEELLLEISRGTLRFHEPDTVRPDATFYFEDVDTAWALLSGRADAFAAFMEGRFRADGYLMWAFALMAMFGSASLPETPTE
ncbi:MAG: SCP2 sterol-binding domain-containing protein [Gammaproteobacteria bacterium]|jgi:putative sterol carrier protein